MSFDYVPIPDLQGAIYAAFMSAALTREDEVAERLTEIAAWGPGGIHLACWSWACVALEALTSTTGDSGDSGDSGFYALEVTRVSTGEVVSVSAIGDTNKERAAQMLTLYGNKDADTSAAIVRTAFGEDHGMGLMRELVGLAVSAAEASRLSSGTRHRAGGRQHGDAREGHPGRQGQAQE